MHKPKPNTNMTMTMKRNNIRKAGGQAISEAAVLMMTLFLFLAFPLMNLGAIGIRTFFIINSAKVAAERACKSLTFEHAANLGQLQLGNNTPAQTVGQNMAHTYLHAFSGIKVLSVKVGYSIVDNQSGVRSGPFYQPLTSYPQYQNTYYLDVDVTAEAQPLITNNRGLLGDVPGLTSAIKLAAHDDRVFENPKGLMN